MGARRCSLNWMCCSPENLYWQQYPKIGVLSLIAAIDRRGICQLASFFKSNLDSSMTEKLPKFLMTAIFFSTSCNFHSHSLCNFSGKLDRSIEIESLRCAQLKTFNTRYSYNAQVAKAVVGCGTWNKKKNESSASCTHSRRAEEKRKGRKLVM